MREYAATSESEERNEKEKKENDSADGLSYDSPNSDIWNEGAILSFKRE